MVYRRVCGTKQIWEILAYTGCFDVEVLKEALQKPDPDAEAEAAPEVSKEEQ